MNYSIIGCRFLLHWEFPACRLNTNIILQKEKLPETEKQVIQEKKIREHQLEYPSDAGLYRAAVPLAAGA